MNPSGSDTASARSSTASTPWKTASAPHLKTRTTRSDTFSTLSTTSKPLQKATPNPRKTANNRPRHLSAGNLLPKPVDEGDYDDDDHHDDNDNDEDDDEDDEDDDEDDDPPANRDLISEHSFVLIRDIGVATFYRRRGIGSSLLEALITEALLMLPSIRFVVSWPWTSDSTADFETPGPSHLLMLAGRTEGGGSDSSGSYSSGGDNGGGDNGGSYSSGSDSSGSRRPGWARRQAKAFNRANGFRPIGVMDFWAKRLGPSA